MASAITHILLSKEIQNKIINPNLKRKLAFCMDSFQVGSLAPDLPYASIADNNAFFNYSNIADNLHLKNTNQIPLQSLIMLKELKGKIDKELHSHAFTFFLGYISHVFADGIIHPYIRDKVGNYNENKSAHRSLEMQLDVLMLEKLSKNSGDMSVLNNINIHDEIFNFSKSNYSFGVLILFKKLIKETYNQSIDENKIFGCINGMYRMLQIAEGDHLQFYRNLPFNTFTFKNIEDIDKNEALVLTNTTDGIPNFLKREKIDFFEDCINQYYERFISISEKAYLYIYEDGEELTESDIPKINLETGRLEDQNHLNLIPEFWK